MILRSTVITSHGIFENKTGKEFQGLRMLIIPLGKAIAFYKKRSVLGGRRGREWKLVKFKWWKKGGGVGKDEDGNAGSY